MKTVIENVECHSYSQHDTKNIYPSWFELANKVRK